MESTNSIHNGKPYWAKRQQPPKKSYYLYWEPSKNSWYISETLGSRTGMILFRYSLSLIILKPGLVYF